MLEDSTAIHIFFGGDDYWLYSNIAMYVKHSPAWINTGNVHGYNFVDNIGVGRGASTSVRRHVPAGKLAPLGPPIF